MKNKNTSFIGEFKDFIIKNEERVSYVFLGVGLTIFVLNIASLLTGLELEYKKNEFGISIFLSIVLIVYTVKILTNKK